MSWQIRSKWLFNQALQIIHDNNNFNIFIFDTEFETSHKNRTIILACYIIAYETTFQGSNFFPVIVAFSIYSYIRVLMVNSMKIIMASKETSSSTIPILQGILSLINKQTTSLFRLYDTAYNNSDKWSYTENVSSNFVSKKTNFYTISQKSFPPAICSLRN